MTPKELEKHIKEFLTDEVNSGHYVAGASGPTHKTPDGVLMSFFVWTAGIASNVLDLSVIRITGALESAKFSIYREHWDRSDQDNPWRE